MKISIFTLTFTAFIAVFMPIGSALTFAEDVTIHSPSFKISPQDSAYLEELDKLLEEHQTIDNDRLNGIPQFLKATQAADPLLPQKLYLKWIDSEQLRLLLAEYITAPQRQSKTGWGEFDELVELFLQTRDAPLSVFKGRPKQQGLDNLVRCSILRDIAEILGQQASLHEGFADGSTERLLVLLEQASNDALSAEGRKAQILRAKQKVISFKKAPHPFISEKWNVEAKALLEASKKWSNPRIEQRESPPLDTSASQQETSPIMRDPAESKSANPTPPITPTQYLLWTLAFLAGLGAIAFVIKRKSE